MNKYKITAIIFIIINFILITAAAFLLLYNRKDTDTVKNTVSPAPASVVTETPKTHPTTAPPAIKPTIKKFLQTAAMPVGCTMYVYGGGWNKEDTGAGEYARSIGIPQEWKDFCAMQDNTYDSSKFRYQITKGLDCSGYVGWTIYNTLESENGKPGYVFFAQEYADKLSAMKLGRKTEKGSVASHKAGDILSSASDQHVWIAIGECSDGSVVLFNCSPPGVSLYGTASPDGNKNSQALKLAEKYMKEYFPDWYGKYKNYSRNTSYLTNYDSFRWDTGENGIMSDPDGYYNMTPQQILEDIFNR